MTGFKNPIVQVIVASENLKKLDFPNSALKHAFATIFFKIAVIFLPTIL